MSCGLAEASARPAGPRVLCIQVPISSDDRSPAAKAYLWSSRIMVASLEMVLPGLAGHWVDDRLGTVVLFMLLGFSIGGTAAVVHLIHMTRTDVTRKTDD
jgi:hypothetical protein